MDTLPKTATDGYTIMAGDHVLDLMTTPKSAQNLKALEALDPESLRHLLMRLLDLDPDAAARDGGCRAMMWVLWAADLIGRVAAEGDAAEFALAHEVAEAAKGYGIKGYTEDDIGHQVRRSRDDRGEWRARPKDPAKTPPTSVVEVPPIAKAPPAEVSPPTDVGGVMPAAAPAPAKPRPARATSRPTRAKRPDNEARVSEEEARESEAAKFDEPLAFVLSVYDDRLWHTPDQTPYVNLGPRNIRVGSEQWSSWLRRAWVKAHNRAIDKSEYAACTDTIAALATDPEKPQGTIFNRVARAGGKIYVDLCNDEYEVVAIGPDGWEVVKLASLGFTRSTDAAALPVPVKGGSVDDLRPLLNLDDDGYRAYVGSIFDALKGGGSYLVNMVSGEQGTTKTTLTQIAAQLVDPRRPQRPGRPAEPPGLPKTVEDLAVTAADSHLLTFDNVSKIGDDMSDALCRVATGGAHEKRKNYTDGTVYRMRFCCPVWINGIGDPVKRGDLGDRAVFYVARPVTKRLPEDVFWREFEAVRPKVLGAIYTAISGALKAEAAGDIPDGVKSTLPRMARSAAWVYRCFGVLGWDYGGWLAVLTGGQNAMQRDQLDGSPLGAALMTWWQNSGTIPPDGLTQSASEWSEFFRKRVADKDKSFVPGTNTITAKFRELAPALRRVGIEVVEGRAKGGRWITIRPLQTP
jgi:hypothetical protein